MSVYHGGNSDVLVSIPAMTGTIAVNFCALMDYIKKIGLYTKRRMQIISYLLLLINATTQGDGLAQ